MGVRPNHADCAHFYQLREVAADALGATTSRVRAQQVCLELLQRCDTHDPNGTHGRLLAVQCILNQTTRYQSGSPVLSQESVVSLLDALLLQSLAPGQSKAAQIVCVEIAILLRAIIPPAKLEGQYRNCLAVVIRHQREAEKYVMEGQLKAVSAKLVLLLDDKHLAEMMRHPSKAVRREAIDHVSAVLDKAPFTEQYASILHVLVDEAEQMTTRVKAAQLLDQMACPLQGDELLSGCNRIAKIALGRGNIIFRDHCLPCLSRMLASVSDGSSLMKHLSRLTWSPLSQLLEQTSMAGKEDIDVLEPLLQAIAKAANAVEVRQLLVSHWQTFSPHTLFAPVCRVPSGGRPLCKSPPAPLTSRFAELGGGGPASPSLSCSLDLT